MKKVIFFLVLMMQFANAQEFSLTRVASKKKILFLLSLMKKH